MDEQAIEVDEQAIEHVEQAVEQVIEVDVNPTELRIEEIKINN